MIHIRCSEIEGNDDVHYSIIRFSLSGLISSNVYSLWERTSNHGKEARSNMNKER